MEFSAETAASSAAPPPVAEPEAQPEPDTLAMLEDLAGDYDEEMPQAAEPQEPTMDAKPSPEPVLPTPIFVEESQVYPSEVPARAEKPAMSPNDSSPEILAILPGPSLPPKPIARLPPFEVPSQNLPAPSRTPISAKFSEKQRAHFLELCKMKMAGLVESKLHDFT